MPLVSAGTTARAKFSRFSELRKGDEVASRIFDRKLGSSINVL